MGCRARVQNGPSKNCHFLYRSEFEPLFAPGFLNCLYLQQLTHLPDLKTRSIVPISVFKVPISVFKVPILVFKVPIFVYKVPILVQR